jgi:parvulin-like peptidyl-prolyl isomerase
MIGTIRKHSKWLWLVIIIATIISFVFWGAGPSRMGNGSGGSATGDYGTIYGHKITQQAFIEARNEFYIFYWFRSHEWPDANPNFTETELANEVYVRLMLFQKATDLGIHVGEPEVVTAANDLLNSLNRNGQIVPLTEFVKQVLQPKGLTAVDFKNFVRQYLIMEQLQQSIGLTGELITPQAAAAAYQRDHQELSAQMVVFSASNYLSSVTVTPDAVAKFYSNYLAAYRLPDRSQVSYVAFDVSNYVAAAEQKLGRTNLDSQVEMNFRRSGMQAVPGAKTPEEAKARIREALLWPRAKEAARQDANTLASTVFAQEPARAENLTTIAQQKGLTVHVTAPFAGEFGPEEFVAPPAFTKAAFGLTTDVPFAGPIVGEYAVYILAYNKQLPSEIPPLDQIRDRVTRDYQWREAVFQAWHAGTDFARSLTGMTADRGFASLCVAAGLQPQVLPPFSLSTQALPELGERAEMNLVKQAAFTTPVGKASGFVTNNAGGFIVYVQSRLPVDQAKMNSELPPYQTAFRRERQNEAFNQWVNLEANRQLRDTPAFRQAAAPGIPRK